MDFAHARISDAVVPPLLAPLDELVPLDEPPPSVAPLLLDASAPLLLAPLLVPLLDPLPELLEAPLLLEVPAALATHSDSFFAPPLAGHLGRDALLVRRARHHGRPLADRLGAREVRFRVVRHAFNAHRDVVFRAAALIGKRRLTRGARCATNGDRRAAAEAAAARAARRTAAHRKHRRSSERCAA